MQTQFYKLWVQSHHSGVSQLPSQVSYHPWPEQWLWICHFWKDELLLWILPTFCGHFIGNSLPISWYFSSLTPTQDVPEILQVVFDELKGHSNIASNTLATSFRTSTTCDICGCCNIEEVKLDIIPLALAKSISLSLDRYLSSENLTGFNKWFCPAFNGFMDSTRETRIFDSGSVL